MRFNSLNTFLTAALLLFAFQTGHAGAENLDAHEQDEGVDVGHIPASFSSASVSNNAVLSVRDEGVLPGTLRVHQKDGLVFFYNNSKDSLLTLKVYFGAHSMHCASDTMELSKDGFISSKEPFGPNNFVGMCFPEKGTYEVMVYGLNKNPKGATAKIIVE